MFELHDQSEYLVNSIIFVVDDNLEIRTTLGEYLRSSGYSVFEFATGEEALAAYQSEPVHAMLIDVTLPGCSGIDVLATVRQTSEMPMLLMSAIESNRNSCLVAGADAFFSKPLRPSHVLEVANTVMQMGGNANMSQIAFTPPS